MILDFGFWISESCRASRAGRESRSGNPKSKMRCGIGKLLHVTERSRAGIPPRSVHLDRRAQLRDRLRRTGVRRGELVAIEMPRGIELVVAMLAALQARAAYLVVDPALPAQRRRQMYDAAAPRLRPQRPASPSPSRP